MRLFGVALVCVALTLAGGGGSVGAACSSTGKVVLRDQFNVLSKAWGRFPNFHVEEGEFLIAPPVGFTTTALNRTKVPADLDICVDVHFKPSTKPGACAGIAFWVTDFDNLYTFQVSNDGQVSVWRRQRGRWVNQLPLLPVASVKQDSGATNALGLTIYANRARLFVNEQFYSELIGYPDRRAVRIGLFGCSPAKSAGIIAFDNLIVTPATPEP